MEQLKSYIQHLPFTEQVSLAAWLSQLIETEVKGKVESGNLKDDKNTIPEPPDWMWNTAEKLYTEFKESGEKGLSWEEVKAMGEKRKSA